MSDLNSTPSGNRIHIGVFGRTNSGKSALINSWTGQNLSIVSEKEGTTTDPVTKSIEINPIGPCAITDTAGFGDKTELGQLRMEKSMQALERTDIAILAVSAKMIAAARTKLDSESEWLGYMVSKKIPVLCVITMIDGVKCSEDELKARFMDKLEKGRLALGKSPLGKATNEWLPKEHIITTSAVSGQGINLINEVLASMVPEDYDSRSLTGSLCSQGDTVLLVMPQDIQAPKGRLILPQVQVIRDLLDKKCHVICCTTDEYESTLAEQKNPPKLIITDSQVFKYVYEKKPEESLLTSFSILLAASKGDINYFMESARAIDSLTPNSKVLIAEACTHAPLSEDIGREKIPAMLRKKIGQELTIDIVSGSDFPADLSGYDLIIHCGACMFNRAHVLSRVSRAKAAGVPMTNYGVCIAHLTGILIDTSSPLQVPRS